MNRQLVHMLSLSRAVSWLRRSVVAVALVVGPVGAGPAPWPEAPFSYFANNVDLESVLREFATSFSLSLSVQPGVAGTVNGRFTARNPTEFISRLGGVYGFTWFTHAGTLHVSKASDIVTRSIPMASGSIGQLRQALYDLGVLEPRFGWGELPDQGVVMVSGPSSYVSLLEATLRQLPPGATAQQVMVFRLRHASAEDRTIMYRDHQMTQPGLATVLRGLVTGRGANEALSAGGGQSQAQPGMQSPLRSSPVLQGEGSAAAGAPANAAPGVGAATAGVSAAPGQQRQAAPPAPRLRGGSIQSDPRLNALIIQDVPERMPVYERLIAQLDVPTALIEIEAMIIDVNSDRARELGINWALRGGGTAVGFGNLSSAPPFGTLSVVSSAAGLPVSPSTLVVDAGNYLVTQIRLLESNGEARIQSRPSVLTTDNTGALLDLSETFYIRVQGERVASVSPVTAGTTLKVTPRLVEGPEPSIQLTIDIEDGTIGDRLIDMLPTVRRSTVSTQAIVRQNETLLIAGHSSDQNIDSDSRVPWLGDIPGLGLLFSNKTRVVQKRERLFMIKPKLVSVTSLVPPVSRAPEAPTSTQVQ